METKRSTNTTWLVVMVLVLFLTLISIDSVNADNGPHGGYTATTDACAGCHRTHTAPTARLLISGTPALCFSCHGNVGAGADTNVMDGLYLERDGNSETPSEGGNPNEALKGGGFVNATMDTDWDTVAASSSVTSAHLNDGSMGTAWGNGALNSGAGAIDFPLSCTSCHDPHGGASTVGDPTYRLLRAIPSDSGAGSGVDVTDETDKVYTLSDTAAKSGNQYFGEEYDTQRDELSEWCSQCHTRYLAFFDSGSVDSGDAIFAYRHLSLGNANCSICHGGAHGFTVPPNPYGIASGIIHRPTCMTCHVAHGSSASMGDHSGSVPWPDGAVTPSGNDRSSLLRVDSRGTCQLCHAK